jgi:hypothetical protein
LFCHEGKIGFISEISGMDAGYERSARKGKAKYGRVDRFFRLFYTYIFDDRQV